MITNGRTSKEKIDDRLLAASGGWAVFCGAAFIFSCGIAVGMIYAVTVVCR